MTIVAKQRSLPRAPEGEILAPSMPFETTLPDPRLSGLVVSYWRLTGLMPGQVYAAAPKRHVELVFNLGPPQLAGRRRPDTLFESCWITGFRQQPIYISTTGANILYGVRFQDFAIPAWLYGSVERDRQWSTDLSGSCPIDRLAGEIEGCANIDAAAGIFDRFFLARYQEFDPTFKSIGSAIRQCEAEQEGVTCHGVIGRLELPARRARALAQEGLGVSLRRFARIARFDRALCDIAEDSGRTIADVAHSVGYYDEAHMAHDFADLLGVTPGAYRSVRTRHRLDVLPHHLLPVS